MNCLWNGAGIPVLAPSGVANVVFVMNKAAGILLMSLFSEVHLERNWSSVKSRAGRRDRQVWVTP